VLLRRTAAVALVTAALTACTATQATTTPAPSPSPSPTVSPTPSATPAPTTPSRRPITIAFGGDVHFEGAVRRHLLADPATAFGAMAPVLRRADLAVVNLETAVTERGTAQDKQYVFRAPASAFRALRAAGIDVATNANNHGMDYGQVGLADTLAAARAQRFPLIGSGYDEDEAYAPYRATVGGWRVAVLGASQVIAPELVTDWTAGPSHPGLASAYRVDRLRQAVRQARRTADTVVVYLHWGVERDSCPSDRQRTLARQLVDAGADVVVGSHAHVVQGSGRMGEAYVAYGLGNFLFYSRSTPTSVLTLTVAGRRVLDDHRTPAVIRDGWTTPLTGRAAAQELARQEALRACANLS
jgi:poly-gamma-glutamate synthesis protein (capsule biosynthesis protein)